MDKNIFDIFTIDTLTGVAFNPLSPLLFLKIKQICFVFK